MHKRAGFRDKRLLGFRATSLLTAIFVFVVLLGVAFVGYHQFGATTTTATTPSRGCGVAPSLPKGLDGKFVSCETGAQISASSRWQLSTNGNLTPSSGCLASPPASITVSGSYLDLRTPAGHPWDCAGVESNFTVSPGHIYQIREYIPALANGNIADYPAWWQVDTGWYQEVDMAEAHSWSTTSPLLGQMCLDMHLKMGSVNTQPNCQTEQAGWHVYTLDWASNGDVVMYYDGTQMLPSGVTGTDRTDDHMILWNNNNGTTGVVNSTVRLDYYAEWDIAQ